MNANKNDTKEFTKQKQRLKKKKKNLLFHKGERETGGGGKGGDVWGGGGGGGGRGGGGKLGSWDWHIYTTIYKIGNKDLLRSTEKSNHYCVITYMGKGSENKWICV